ncbi:hypothetical protein DSO57_1034439 [Entomophthora muscae]|uniref:Uncharacterized protein n=1 Tax=Entomophthora muscae TaxID=34485 RepID=A0ACC2RQV3_9FUNG|nr:hypothetical protein DSO57_1034439 [Entomophthora muscae]
MGLFRQAGRLYNINTWSEAKAVAQRENIVMKSFFKLGKTQAASRGKLLEGITVANGDGQQVLLSNFWKTKTVLLKVLRRFGCPLCRYEISLLSELKPEFDALDVKLIAIGFEKLELKDYLAGRYGDWEVLVDTKKEVYSALNLKKVSVSTVIKDLISSSRRAAISAAAQAGIHGNLKGDGFQLGGTFVIEKGTGELVYEFRQSSVSDFSSLKEIYQSCNGDPADVEEKAPRECINYIKA